MRKLMDITVNSSSKAKRILENLKAQGRIAWTEKFYHFEGTEYIIRYEAKEATV